MQAFHEFLQYLDSLIGQSWWFPLTLIGTGLFFTIYLGFPQIRYFLFAFRFLSGKYDKHESKGDTSHFQALTTALSGTVGTGNIAGVALAVHVGGPAALFWMLVTAAVGMTTKFVEVTLSHKYREVAQDGSIAGGPMYYMKNKMNMKWLAVIFAIATVISAFGTGNMPQSNSIANALNSTFGMDKTLIGGVLAVVLGFVIIGGIKRIASVTERLVPLMALVYFIGALAVILTHLDNVIPSFVSIFADVFNGTAATGGFLGASISFAFSKGVARGLFSNEAGQGSAPIAHAAARADEPVSEGMVAILEPFIDTIVICLLTGLVLLSSGVWKEKHLTEFDMTDILVLNREVDERESELLMKALVKGDDQLLYTGQLQVDEGKITTPVTILHARSIAEEIVVSKSGEVFSGKLSIDKGVVDGSIEIKGKSLVHSAPLTSIAFTRSFFGDFGQYIVSIGLLLFAFSSAISWSYYGDRAMTFLVGTQSVLYFRMLYVLGFFVASFTDTTIIWTIAAVANPIMALPNLFGILWLHKDMKQSVKDFWVDFKKKWPGEKVPN